MKHICLHGFQIKDMDLYNHCFSWLSPLGIKSFLKLQLYLFQPKYPVSNAMSGSVEICWVNQGYIYELGPNFIGLTLKVETWYRSCFLHGYPSSGLHHTLHAHRISRGSIIVCMSVSSETEQVESKDNVVFVFPGSQCPAQHQALYILTQYILLNDRR